MAEWQLKKDDEGNIVFQDNKPVYVDPEGKELALDPPNMYQKIIDLGKEAKGHRERADAHEETLKAVDGIEDLPAFIVDAKKAIETVKNFDEKDWLKADKVDKLKAEMKEAFDDQQGKLKKSFEEKITDLNGIVTKKDLQIRKLMVTSKFATSPYFSGPDPKTNLPPEIAETYFGKNFKVEEDEKSGVLKLVAYYNNGDAVYSRVNPGEIAEFDEAITAIFESYPGKDKLLRAGGAGSGGTGGRGEGGIESDDIKKLEKEYADAQKAGDAKSMVAIKNKLFKARQAARAAGAA